MEPCREHERSQLPEPVRHAFETLDRTVRDAVPTGSGVVVPSPSFLFTYVSNPNFGATALNGGSFDQPYGLFGSEHSLTAAHFAEFERCYGSDPNGQSPRSATDSPDGRWRVFGLDEIRANHYKLDGFKWLRDDESDDPDDLPEPEELITEAMGELQLALDELADMQLLLENGNGSAPL